MTLPQDAEFKDFENELSSENFYVVKLSPNEVLYLDDCLTLMIEREYESPLESGMHMATMRSVLPTAPLAVPIELIEKIGMGVLYVTDPDNAGRDVEITFDIAELYTLREVTQSYVKVGAEPVGFNIKRKLYQALYSKKYEDVKKLNYLISDYNATASPENQIIPSSINTKDQ